MRIPRPLVKLPLSLLLLALLFGGSCHRSGVFQVEELHFKKSLNPCKPEQGDCARVEISYPILKGGSPEGRGKINAEIRRFALSRDDDSQAKDVEDLAAGFFAEYQKFGKEFPQAPQVWWESRKATVIANAPKVLSLREETEGYMGGAHPNTNVSYASYNAATGKRYALADWLKPGYEGPLRTLGEKAFRKARNLKPEESLDDAGFTFENGFQLNDNFAAASQGLIFYFNPYEVASYADGPTELTIPYSDLKDWLLPRGPLTSLARP